MEETNDSLSDHLAVTVSKSGAIGLTSEMVEFAIDQTLESGVLKDLPFVGWIAKGFSISQTISDRILFNKILRFLTQLEQLPHQDKTEFQLRIQTEPEFRREVGEHLLNFLDRLDDLKKTEILASCFDHFLSGEIEHGYFVELSSAIDRLTSGDLSVISGSRSKRLRFPIIGRAVASGVMEYGVDEIGDGDEDLTLSWQITSLGRDLRDIVLGQYRGRDERLEKEREAKIREYNQKFGGVSNPKQG